MNDFYYIYEVVFIYSLIMFYMVFWLLFFMGEVIVVEFGEFNYYFIQNVGYWIFGVYNIVMVIVLLNMLIVMMFRFFEKIQVMQILFLGM